MKYIILFNVDYLPLYGLSFVIIPTVEFSALPRRRSVRLLLRFTSTSTPLGVASVSIHKIWSYVIIETKHVRTYAFLLWIMRS